jgi:hypothetical protein
MIVTLISTITGHRSTRFEYIPSKAMYMYNLRTIAGAFEGAAEGDSYR